MMGASIMAPGEVRAVLAEGIALGMPPRLRVTVHPFPLRSSTEHLFLATCAGRPSAAWLDSASAAAGRGRYSVMAADPFLLFTWKGEAGRLAFRDGGETVRGNPFAVLRGLLSRFHADGGGWRPAGVPFAGGAIGYFSYDLGRYLERLPSLAADGADMPDCALAFYDCGVTVDHRARVAYVWGVEGPGGRDLARRLSTLSAAVEAAGHRPRRLPADHPAQAATDWRWNFTPAGYADMVARAQGYIAAGDIYQVNLSQRLDARWAGDPLSLYGRLRRAVPEPYGAFLDFPGGAVLCASPELFLRLDGERVTTRPIKGTRPRGTDAAEDRRLRAELLASAKDRAELAMIVDLERNDLGKVCRTGSVQVPEVWGVESHPVVHHLVGTVTGRLRPGLGPAHLLEAAFPGGSITGAPKLRAMEVIEELEPVRRGVYTGALGYLGFDGAMALNIVIRTVVLKDGRARLQVGGGIVADSVPELEYRETLAKAAGLLGVLGLA